MKNTAPFVLAAAIFSLPLNASAQVASVNLNTYVRVGRYDLPEPTRTAHPANSLLAQEASGVTYDKDTDSLFVVGDGGTSVVQVSKTGALINSMTLPLDATKPQGTYYWDNEGITYVGGGKFVLIEEQFRQADLFTYTPNTTLSPATVQTVKLGTSINTNDGLEGASIDPFSGGYVFIKEKNAEGIFQTTMDFSTGTASNGSPSAANSTNLFNPALLGLSDFADIFSLSNLVSLTGQPDYSHLLVLSQASARIVETDRSGNILSSLQLVSDPGNPLNIADQQHEGLTMDDNGFLYIVSENGGGDSNHPQLWVFAPTPEPTSILILITGVGLFSTTRTRRASHALTR